MRLNEIRNKIAYKIATGKARKRMTEGVTDDNFYDYNAYVDLVAKSLRRMANDRQAYTVMNWLMPEGWGHLSTEELDVYAAQETNRLNKWADILEIDADEFYNLPRFDAYFDALEDHLFGSKQPLTSELDASSLELDRWESAIRDLKSDILAELGANYFYMWD